MRNDTSEAFQKMVTDTPIGLVAATKVIKMALHITCLETERPIGFLLVAPPGTGKSYLLTRFVSDHIVIANDITGRGLENLTEKLLAYKSQGFIGYVVIPDLLRAMSRTLGWEQFKTLANILLEEGIQMIVRYDKDISFKDPVRAGLMAAMTSQSYQSEVAMMARSGFLSRFGVFAFAYERDDEAKIEDNLSMGNTGDGFREVINTPKSRIVVTINEKEGAGIKALGKLLQNGKDPSFRSINFVRKLVKANAVMNGREAVTRDDLNKVYALIPFFIPPDPASTDLEYFILKKIDPRELEKHGYRRQAIFEARQRLIAKRLIRFRV